MAESGGDARQVESLQVGDTTSPRKADGRRPVMDATDQLRSVAIDEHADCFVPQPGYRIAREQDSRIGCRHPRLDHEADILWRYSVVDSGPDDMPCGFYNRLGITGGSPRLEMAGKTRSV